LDIGLLNLISVYEPGWRVCLMDRGMGLDDVPIVHRTRIFWHTFFTVRR